MKAKLYLKSRYPIGYQLEIFFFNHLYMTHNNGFEYLLEWENVSKDFYIDSKGYLYVYCTLDDLYDCFDGISINDLTVNFLRNSMIKELSYESYSDEEEEHHEPLDLILLSIDCEDGLFIIEQIVG